MSDRLSQLSGGKRRVFGGVGGRRLAGDCVGNLDTAKVRVGQQILILAGASRVVKMSQVAAVEQVVYTLEPGKKTVAILWIDSRADADELAFLSEQPSPRAPLDRHSSDFDVVGPTKAVEIRDFNPLHGRLISLAAADADDRRAFDDFRPGSRHSAACQ